MNKEIKGNEILLVTYDELADIDMKVVEEALKTNAKNNIVMVHPGYDFPIFFTTGLLNQMNEQCNTNFKDGDLLYGHKIEVMDSMPHVATDLVLEYVAVPMNEAPIKKQDPYCRKCNRRHRNSWCR